MVPALHSRGAATPAAEGKDAGGGARSGLSPHPVPTLVASGEQLRRLEAGASERELRVAESNEVARRSRDYVEYLGALAATESQDVECGGGRLRPAQGRHQAHREAGADALEGARRPR